MTPLGAAWAIPGAAVSGSAAAAVVVAVLTVIALGPLVRARAVAADDDRTAGIRARARGLGWFALTPSTPRGDRRAQPPLLAAGSALCRELVIVPIAAGSW
jgi:ABC-2 type transport system permease protein